MEPQENCYFEKKCCKKRNCFALIIAILAVLFFGVIGAAWNNISNNNNL